MKSVETESQDVRVCRAAYNLAALAKGQKVGVRESKLLCLEAMNLLLAHPDFFCIDFYEQLEDAKRITEEEIKDEDKTGDDSALIGEPLDEQRLKEKYDEKTIDWVLGKCRKTLDGYRPQFQQDVLVFLQSELLEKLLEDREDEVQQAAMEGLVNAVLELPRPEQVPMFRGLLEQVKNRKAVAA